MCVEGAPTIVASTQHGGDTLGSGCPFFSPCRKCVAGYVAILSCPMGIAILINPEEPAFTVLSD